MRTNLLANYLKQLKKNGPIQIDNHINLQETFLAVCETSESLTSEKLPVKDCEHKKTLTLPKKALRVLGEVVYVMLLFIMVSLVFFMIQSRVAGEMPAVYGHHLFIVRGGSMSPTIETGSLALVRPVEPQNISQGDIITFYDSGAVAETSNHQNLTTAHTTHRVMEIRHQGGLHFITRGDANQENDPPVGPEQIRGRVEMHVPYVGALLDFVFSPAGLLAMVILPCLLVIVLELRFLYHYYTEEERKKKEAQAQAEEKEEDILQFLCLGEDSIYEEKAQPETDSDEGGGEWPEESKSAPQGGGR